MSVLVDGAVLNYDTLPERHRGTVRRYIEGGIDPGTGWLTVLAAHLSAVCACDDAMVAELPTLFRWLYNYAPPASWGSYANVAAWMASRRAERRAA